ncbi:hypothetical protein A2U01_0007635, partial [Trifolium medium]|nr:hypothetical protein [Trifolium medium]
LCKHFRASSTATTWDTTASLSFDIIEGNEIASTFDNCGSVKLGFYILMEEIQIGNEIASTFAAVFATFKESLKFSPSISTDVWYGQIKLLLWRLRLKH